MNVVFDDKGKLKAIIDWENCKIGEEYEDLIYIIWTWSNIGALDRKHEQLLDYFEKIIKYYNPNDKVRKNFVDKMKEVMDSKQQEAKYIYIYIYMGAVLKSIYEYMNGWNGVKFG